MTSKCTAPVRRPFLSRSLHLPLQFFTLWNRGIFAARPPPNADAFGHFPLNFLPPCCESCQISAFRHLALIEIRLGVRFSLVFPLKTPAGTFSPCTAALPGFPTRVSLRLNPLQPRRVHFPSTHTSAPFVSVWGSLLIFRPVHFGRGIYTAVFNQQTLGPVVVRLQSTEDPHRV